MVKNLLPTRGKFEETHGRPYRRPAWPTPDQSSWPRVFFGMIVTVVVALLWGGGVLLLARQYPFWSGSLASAGSVMTLGFLLAVAGLGVGVGAAMRLVHRRSIATLIGRGPKALRHFFIAATIVWAFSVAFGLASLPFSDPLERALPVSTWLFWLPFALFALLLQTGAEELLFRGYLQSHLAARFSSRVIWMGVPSILFGLLHFSPFLPPLAAWTYVAAAALYGVLAADLTARTGNLGAAWGFHFANNTLAVTIVAVDSNLGDLALFRSPLGLTDALTPSPWLLLDVLMLIVVWRLIRRAVGA